LLVFSCRGYDDGELVAAVEVAASIVSECDLAGEVVASSLDVSVHSTGVVAALVASGSAGDSALVTDTAAVQLSTWPCDSSRCP
jgi:hypothetical protein